MKRIITFVFLWFMVVFFIDEAINLIIFKTIPSSSLVERAVFGLVFGPAASFKYVLPPILLAMLLVKTSDKRINFYLIVWAAAIGSAYSTWGYFFDMSDQRWWSFYFPVVTSLPISVWMSYFVESKNHKESP